MFQALLLLLLADWTEGCRWVEAIKEKRVKVELFGKGLHRELHVKSHLASINRFSECRILYELTVPAGAYIDSDVVNSSLPNHAVYTKHRFDVEAPKSRSESQKILILSKIQVRKSFVIEDSFTLPVHIRYHAAKEGASLTEKVQFVSPTVALDCPVDFSQFQLATCSNKRYGVLSKSSSWILIEPLEKMTVAALYSGRKPKYNMTNANLPQLEQEALLNKAKTFDKHGTAHVNLIHCLLKKPLLTKKMFYVQYLAQYIEIDLKQQPEVFRNYPIGENTCEELTRNLIKALNSQVTKLGMRVVRIRHELTGVDYVTLISTRSKSTCLGKASGFTEDEKYLLNVYINKIMTSEDTLIDRFWLIQQARNLPNTMNATKTEIFLERLCDDNWFEEKNGNYTIGVRGVAELGAILKKKFGLPSCSVCDVVIVRGKLAKECGFCEEKLHKPCWKKLCGDGAKQRMNCPGKNCN